MDVLRHDSLQFRSDGVDPETGILRGRAVLAKEGVYTYSDAAGQTWREYVPMSTLTSPAWLDSLKLAPATLNHPSQMVTADNAKSLAVGAIGDGVTKLGDRIAAPITIWDRAAVTAATGTHSEISLGYWADVEVKAGEFGGQKYDRVQTSRRANHVALVPQGRHGPEVALHADSARMDGAQITITEGNTMTADEKTKFDAAVTSAETLQAKLDAAQAEVAKLKADADKAQAATVAQIRARVGLEAQVRSVCGSDHVCDGKDDRALRVDALAKLGVTVDADKSADYVAARLDAALESRAAGQTAAAVVANALNAGANQQPAPSFDANDAMRQIWA